MGTLPRGALPPDRAFALFVRQASPVRMSIKVASGEISSSGTFPA